MDFKILNYNTNKINELLRKTDELQPVSLSNYYTSTQIDNKIQEIIEARTNLKGVTYSSLKDRLNALDTAITNVGTGGSSSTTPGNSASSEYTIINVKENGCKGDGSTNDLPSLKAIFSNISNNSIIYFPAGTYLLGNGDSTELLLLLTEVENVIIMGDGSNNTVLKAHPRTPVKMNMGILKLLKCVDCSVKGLELDGNLKSRYDNNGALWDDSMVTYYNMSNLAVNGGKNILIEDIYSHHPVMDCLQIGRSAGGTTPNGEIIMVKDCVFQYGYRQGVTIEGYNKGVLQDCDISYTSCETGTNGTKLGTSPMAGIDSETWGSNYDWTIQRCTFTDNYINFNDGTIRFVFKDNILNNSNFQSETPSCGARTYDIVCKNNMLIDSIIEVHNRGFVFEGNTIKLTSGTTKQIKFIDQPNYIYYKDGATPTVFKNNVIMIVADSSGSVNFKSGVIYPYMQEAMILNENTFINCAFNAFNNDNGTFSAHILNNTFKNETSTSHNMRYAKSMISNNRFIGNFTIDGTRPIPTSVDIGVMSFDTATGKPIWFNGSKWVDATGTTV